jgi:hypothetical protein
MHEACQHKFYCFTGTLRPSAPDAVLVCTHLRLARILKTHYKLLERQQLSNRGDGSSNYARGCKSPLYRQKSVSMTLTDHERREWVTLVTQYSDTGRSLLLYRYTIAQQCTIVQMLTVVCARDQLT